MANRFFRLVCLSALILSQFSPGALWAMQRKQNTPIPRPQTYEWTDDLGRCVQVPSEPKRICPSGNLSQMVLYSLAPQMLVGWATRVSEASLKYLSPIVATLPTYGALYGKDANLNKEALLASGPDLIVDMGEIKGSRDTMAGQLDSLQKQLGIPIVFVECSLKSTPRAYRQVGKILNLEAEAESLAKHAEEAITTASAARSKIQRAKTVLYATSPDALLAIPAGSFHAEVLNMVGLDNVVPKVGSASSQTVSLEQILDWDPDIILLGHPEAFKKVTTSKLWAPLNAVKTHNVFLIPQNPFPFIDAPPATNRIAGIWWLGNLVYPDEFGLGMNKTMNQIAEYYRLFYKYTGPIEPILQQPEW